MTVLLRGSGPGLVYNDPNAFEASEVLADPELVLLKAEFVDGAVAWPEVATNDDWASDDQEAMELAFAKTGAVDFEDGSKDAAIVIDLEPGVYSAYLKGVSDATGIGLVELYEVSD